MELQRSGGAARRVLLMQIVQRIGCMLAAANDMLLGPSLTESELGSHSVPSAAAL